MQQLGERLVAFEIPDGDGFREHALERTVELFRTTFPAALFGALAVRRDKCPEFDVVGNFARDALHLLDAQHAVYQERLHLCGLFFAQAVQDVLCNAFEDALDLYGDVWVVEKGDVQGKTGKQPPDAHQDVRLSGVVVADEGGEPT